MKHIVPSPLFSRISIITVLLVTFFSCIKKTGSNTERPLLQNIAPALAVEIKEQPVFKTLLYAYNPNYVQYRLKQKQTGLTNESYQQEFASLTNMRNYYLYQLQQTYSIHPKAIINLIRNEYPGYFITINFDNGNTTNEPTTAATITEMNCPAGLVFNPATLMCDFPENVSGGIATYCVDDETGVIASCDFFYSDDNNKPYRGSMQFQWNNNTISCSWAQTTPITKEEGIAKLDCAYNQLTTSQKQAFECAYNFQKNIIQTKSLPVKTEGYSKYVNSCCPNCINALGNDGGARCDIVINKGESFKN